jgi:hypothetical protein
MQALMLGTGYPGSWVIPAAADNDRPAPLPSPVSPTLLLHFIAATGGLIRRHRRLRSSGRPRNGGQFLPHPLKRLFGNLLLGVHMLNRLILGDPLMGQFGL